MAMQRRTKAGSGTMAAQPGAATKVGQQAKTGQRASAAGTTPAAGASSYSSALAILALAAGLASAFCEWPVYLVYEKDLRRPAIAFTVNLSITAILALLVGASPQVRALKSSAPATAPSAASEPASEDAARAQRAQRKHSKRSLIGGLSLLIVTLYFAFGLYGPSGVLTGTCLTAFIFLVLP